MGIKFVFSLVELFLKSDDVQTTVPSLVTSLTLGT